MIALIVYYSIVILPPSDKLGEMGELTEEDGDDVDMEEMLAKKKKNQMNVIEELINTERTYCNHITLVQETMKNIESVQVSEC